MKSNARSKTALMKSSPLTLTPKHSHHEAEAFVHLVMFFNLRISQLGQLYFNALEVKTYFLLKIFKAVTYLKHKMDSVKPFSLPPHQRQLQCLVLPLAPPRW